MTNYRYVRVSTLEQDPAGQLDAMAASGVAGDRVFVEHASGALDSRPELAKLLAALRPGDTPGGVASHLIRTVTELGERGIGFHSLTRRSTPPHPRGRVLFGSLPPWRRSSATSSANARWPA